MGLTSLFKRTPNHIKLVRDCYPHSKTAVEPESNALGKLTFYTRRRPVKLSKVGRALLRRSQKNSESIEHLCITLSILKKLLDECRNDVNVFSSEAMAIIDIAFKRAQAAARLSHTNPHTLVELYEKIASAAPAVEDNAYLALLGQFCQLVHDEKTMQLRLIGIHALEGVVTSELFQQLDFEEQAHLIIPTLIFALMDSRAEPLTLHESSSQSTTSLNPGTSRRSSSDGLRPSLNDRRARSIRIAKGLEGTEKPPEKDDASRAALNCLKLAFRYAQPRHLEKFLAEATAFFDTRADTWSVPRWCCWIAGRFMDWTQPQYRFAIVKFWLDELDAGNSKTDNSQRQETVLAVLVDRLSSPKTSVVNLAIGDVLSTLIDQIVLTPEKPLLRQGVLALASHIYYPEQINDLVGDTLSAVSELSESQERNKLPGNKDDAKVALLGCCYDMIDKKAGSGLKLSGEQLHASLSILNDPDMKVRLAYLKFLELAFRLNNAQTPTTRSGQTNGANHSDIPAITVQPSAGLVSPSTETMRFARDAQVRLFAYLQHVPDLSPQELNALQSVLEAIYAKRNPQIVLDCVPVLVSWQNAEHSESSEVKPLIARALQAIARTWDAPPASPFPTGDKLIASIAASTSLQQASSLTEDELRERLSQPYSFSPISARNSVSHRRHSRRTRSPHGSISHLSTHTANNRLSGPSSIFTTSLADLKQSLVSSPTSGNGNGAATHSHGNGSPNRSIAPSTAASSFAERGSLTPPNGSAGLTMTNGQGGHLSPKTIPGQRKPRLDRIIGSTDDTALQSIGGKSPTKIRSPPYQLS